MVWNSLPDELRYHQCVILTVSNNSLKQSCLVSTSVTSALKVNLTLCALWIHILLIYLLFVSLLCLCVHCLERPPLIWLVMCWALTDLQESQRHIRAPAEGARLSSDASQTSCPGEELSNHWFASAAWTLLLLWASSAHSEDQVRDSDEGEDAV